MKGHKDDEWLSTADGNIVKVDGKIPLQRTWTFWFFKPSDAISTEEEWNRQLQRLDDFDTIQDFWACYNALPSPTTFNSRQCYHMMMKGVRPEWEDVCNRMGGTWNFKVDKDKADEVWQLLLLALIGEQFSDVLPKVDDICGVTAKGGPQALVFQVWHRDESQKAAVYEKLQALLSKAINCSNMFYKSHQDELKKAGKPTGPAAPAKK